MALPRDFDYGKGFRVQFRPWTQQAMIYAKSYLNVGAYCNYTDNFTLSGRGRVRS